MWICAFYEANNGAGQLACLRMLAHAGADLEAKSAFYGRTALHQAAGNGTVTVVKDLIILGADTSARTAEGNTPLHEACKTARKKERLETVQTLVEAGCDPLAKNRAGKRPADIALQFDHSDVLPILEQAPRMRERKG